MKSDLFDDLDYPSSTPDNDLLSEIADDVQASAGVTNDAVTDRLGALSSLARRQLDLEREIAEAEEQLKKLKRQLLVVSSEDIPLLMSEIGLASIKLTDGSFLEVKENLYASIPKKNKPACADWLQEHDLEGLISNTVSISFDRGHAEQAVRCADLLLDNGFEDVQLAEDMNTASVKAALRNLLEDGVDVPLQLFGVTIVKETKIKLP